MVKRKEDLRTNIRTKKKPFDVKRYATRLVLKGGFDKETEKSLIDEIEEICAFEYSLED